MIGRGAENIRYIAMHFTFFIHIPNLPFIFQYKNALFEINNVSSSLEQIRTNQAIFSMDQYSSSGKRIRKRCLGF